MIPGLATLVIAAAVWTWYRGPARRRRRLLHSDLIIAAGDTDLAHMTAHEAVSYVGGPQGSAVTLVVDRGGIEMVFTRRRAWLGEP